MRLANISVQEVLSFWGNLGPTYASWTFVVIWYVWQNKLLFCSSKSEDEVREENVAE